MLDLKHYETVYITDPSLSENENKTIHEKIDQIVAKFDGQLKHRDDWGLRELAYQINNESNGHYFVVTFSGKGGVVEEIERNFKISEKVIRFLSVQTAADYDYVKEKKLFQPVAEEDIKKPFNKRK